jgi:nucleoporin NUP1
MFKPKKVHQIVPMRKDKDDMPRLGTTEKKKKRVQKDESSKPYTGQGGMKKLLARRKLEAEIEKEKEVSESMDDIVDTTRKVAEKSEESLNFHVVAAPIQEPAVQQHRVNGRETSSLRVGRTRISRQHIERPPPSRSMNNKFSAVYDEDESIDVAGETEESQKVVPIFEAPKGFSFAAEVRFNLFCKIWRHS